MTAPAWRQLQAVLIDRITSGQYAPGRQGPSENEIALKFATTRTTVRRALAALRYEGWGHPRARARYLCRWPAPRGRRLARWNGTEPGQPTVWRAGRAPLFREL